MRSVAMVLALISLQSFSCDVCGVFLGMTPQDRVSSLGLYHRFRLLQGEMAGVAIHKHGDTHHEEQAIMTNYRETYSTLELRADLWLTQRFSLLLSVPVAENVQTADGVVSAHSAGIGDPFMLARYVLIDAGTKDDPDAVLHRVILGGGMKFPIGVSDRMYNDELVDHDLQPGSGSWDALGSVEYHTRFGRWGGSVQTIARWNGSDHADYRMGHGLSSSLEVSYGFTPASWQVRPFVGAYHERMGLDADHDEAVEGTGCNTLFAQGGTRLWWKRWSMNLTGQFVVLSDEGDLMLPNRFRSLVGVSYFLRS